MSEELAWSEDKLTGWFYSSPVVGFENKEPVMIPVRMVMMTKRRISSAESSFSMCGCVYVYVSAS